METPTLQGYGFVSDSDESLKSKTGGKFGGNFGSGLLTKFAYNPNVAKEGEPAREAIEIVVQIGDNKYQDWISPITKVYDKNNVVLTDPTKPEYIKGYNEAITQQNAMVIHYLKAVGVAEETLRAALTATPIASFADYATRVCNLLPTNYATKPLDVFLEYQWNFGKKADGSLNTKTFPTLPGNMKGGYFIIPAVAGSWREEKVDGGLKYLNQNNQEHPFHRSENFMNSKKGYQQEEGKDNAPQPANTAMAPITPGDGSAQASSWATPAAGAPAPGAAQ